MIPADRGPNEHEIEENGTRLFILGLELVCLAMENGGKEGARGDDDEVDGPEKDALGAGDGRGEEATIELVVMVSAATPYSRTRSSSRARGCMRSKTS